MAYCMYLRKSRKDHDAERISHEDTLARHRSILLELADSNHHTIGEIYEEVVSGDTIRDRPQIQRMIADLIAGRWEGVYVAAIDRLARGDPADQGTILRVMQLTGAKIITPTKVVDVANPDDETLTEMSLFIARQEYKASTRRQLAGRERSLEEGKFIGSIAAYGYRKIKLANQRGYSIELHPEEAKVVQDIGRWYLYGRDGVPMGAAAIASYLTDTGVPTGQHGKVWSASRIHRMLSNPVYAGFIRYGYEKLVKTPTLSGVVKRRQISSDCRLFRGIHPAIWSADMYEAIQQKLHGYQKHLPVRKGAKLSNPLAGLLICGECGHVMSHLPACGRQPAIVKCRTRGCPTVQTYRKPVEQAVLAVLRQWLDDAGHVSDPPVSAQPSADRSALLAMQAELDKLRRQIDRVQDLFEQEVYSLEDYRQRRTRLDQRVQELRGSISAETARLDAIPVYASPKALAPALLHLFDAYDGATAQQKNDMLKSCISSIVYRKSKAGVVIRGQQYSDPNGFELDVYPLIER